MMIMPTELSTAVTVFMAFFAIMNPIANTAVFAGMAGDLPSSERNRLALRSLSLAFIIVCLFSILGKSLFHVFGITLPALRITGGILVFMVGYHMLHGEGSKLHSGSHDDSQDMAISPLAVPILAGPGTIATAMNFSASGNGYDIAITIFAFSVLCLITYLCFRSSARIVDVIGNHVMSIITRMMGLILAVIGVQMLIEGIKASF